MTYLIVELANHKKKDLVKWKVAVMIWVLQFIIGKILDIKKNVNSTINT
jgi:hypothetical protein